MHLTTGAAGAGNGLIRGRVTLRRAAPPAERRPTVAELGAPAERDRSDRRQAVVYLEAAPRGAFEHSEPGRAVMDQHNETFVPHVLAVTTGTIVAFPNSDRIYHNVFSLSKIARFDLGRYAVGRSKSIRFDRPGIVRVFCDIHSHMNAFILVFSHPFFAITDVEGRYRIDNVPPGTYNVIAWNEGLFLGTQAGGRVRWRRGGARLPSPMKTLSSLRSRIFLASALLAVLSIGAAIYVVSVRATREAENALQREILATRALVDQLHQTRAETFTMRARLIAGDPRLKAAVDTNDPATVQNVANEYLEQFKSNLLLVTHRSGGLLAAVGAVPATAQTVADQPAVRDAIAGRDSFSLLAQSDGMLQLVTVPIAIGLTNPDILGTLSVGFLLDDSLAAQLKAITGSEIAFGRRPDHGPRRAKALRRYGASRYRALADSDQFARAEAVGRQGLIDS